MARPSSRATRRTARKLRELVRTKPNVQPNDGAYGSFKAIGATATWPGIWFSDAGTGGYFLWKGQYQGAYDTAIGWRWRFNNGNLDIGTVPGAAVSAPRTSWVHNSPVVAQEIGWKNNGNDHTIVDNSGATYRPDKSNPDVEWQANYPTFMGFNGTNTYGVRVDRARHAEHLKSGATVAASPANGDNSNAVATTSWVLANAESSMERVSARNPSGNVTCGSQCSDRLPRGFVTNRAMTKSTSNTLVLDISGKGTLRFLSAGMSSSDGWLTVMIDGATVMSDVRIVSSGGAFEPGLHTTYVGAVVASYDSTNGMYYCSAVPSDFGLTFKNSLQIYMRTNSVSVTAYCNYAYALH